MQTPDPPRL